MVISFIATRMTMYIIYITILLIILIEKFLTHYPLLALARLDSEANVFASLANCSCPDVGRPLLMVRRTWYRELLLLPYVKKKNSKNNTGHNL